MSETIETRGPYEFDLRDSHYQRVINNVSDKHVSLAIEACDRIKVEKDQTIRNFYVDQLIDAVPKIKARITVAERERAEFLEQRDALEARIVDLEAQAQRLRGLVNYYKKGGENG